MIYQYTHEWVMDVSPHTGEPKTNTRRLVKAGEFAANQYGMWIPDLDEWHRRFADLLTSELVDNRALIVVKIPPARDKYVVQNTYAVQPGRGKKAVGRIRITDINREDVRQISEADARAEGFRSTVDFLALWCEMHDPKALVECFLYVSTPRNTIVGVDADRLLKRPAERYDAWVLSFVKE